MLKILHTSDWHLGRSLKDRKRYDEFESFLQWLAQTIEDQSIDVLLVAGDVFDTSTPGNRAQELYYRFLCRVSASCCNHVVVIAGNHDSPSFLNAPRELLRALNVHVIGSATENPADEVIILRAPSEPEGSESSPVAIVCAVPYLRDRDIRKFEPGETIADKNARLIEGLKNHYIEVCSIAEQRQAEFNDAGFEDVPIIGMGHLFTSGARTVDGDGVRELYVGTLAHAGRDVFPPSIDYLALGHLHIPQPVAKTDHIRYCGSPIPMGFGEANQQKKVIIVTFDQKARSVQELPVPLFQQLIRLEGTLDDITGRLEMLKAEQSTAWLEIEYTGENMVSNLRELVENAVSDSNMEIISIKNRRIVEGLLGRIREDETLDDLSPVDIFVRCMDAHEISDEDREELTDCYKEIILQITEDDGDN